MSIRVLIVDDEPLARTMIRELLNKRVEIEILAECKTGVEAVEAVRRLRPDLMFLDVQMPEMDGFAVLERLTQEERPQVVFVTAHDKYAIAAFEVNALDYLLKPFTPDRFERALERAVHDLSLLQNRAQAQDKLSELLNTLTTMRSSAPAKRRSSDRLVVRDSGRIVFLKANDIDFIEAARDYACIHAVGKTYLLHDTMSNLENTLDAGRFMRIHRSAIVNLSRVTGIDSDGNGESLAVMQDHSRIKISRSCREKLLQKMCGV